MNIKRKFNISAFISTIIIVLLLSFAMSNVYAYFTAIANKEITIDFATIDVNMVDGNGTDISSFPISLEGVTPGSTLNFSSVNIKNKGTTECYALLNLDVTITAPNAYTLHYNKWFDINGNEVNHNDFAINEVAATIMASGETINTSMQWQIPGDPISNDYQNGTITATLGAYGVQTLLPDAVAYVDKDLYATYFICKNANKIYDNSNNLLHSPYSNSDRTVDGVTYKVNNDGSIFVDGTSTAAAAFYLDQTINFKTNTIYSAKLDILKGSITSYCYMLARVRNTNGNTDYTTIARVGEGIGYISLNEGQQIDLIYIQCAAGYAQSGVIKPYVFEGNYINFDEITTEPLMKITGKNLFNITKLSSGDGRLEETVTISGNDITFTYNTNNQGDTFPFAFWLETEQNTDYTLSIGKDVSIGSIYIYSDRLWGTRVDYSSINSTNSMTFNSRDNDKVLLGFYSQSSYRDGTGTEIVSNIQIEKGTVATAYEPYLGYQDEYDTVTKTVTRNVGKIEFDGTEDWFFLINTNTNWRSAYITKSIIPTMNENNVSEKLYCSHITYRYLSNYYRDRDTLGIMGYSDRSAAFIMTIPSTMASTKEEWIKYVSEQYAQGTPVTVWYALNTTTEQTVFTNKNLYEGKQKLFYETDKSSNCSSSAILYITKDATKDIDSSGQELGGELFEYLFDKQFVLSCKIRRYEDEDVTNPRIGLRLSNSNNTSIAELVNFKNKISQDGKWNCIWIAVPNVSKTYPNTTQYLFWLADYGAQTYRHFEIKDIQIEIGESPTDYTPVDSTVYDIVNGVELRQVGDVKDTYDASTGILTQNIAKYEFDGTENWWSQSEYYLSNNTYLFVVDIFKDRHTNESFTTNYELCSHFKNAYTSLQTSTNNNEEGFVFHSAEIYKNYLYIRVAKSRLSEGTPAAFKQWLADEYAAGRPVTVWYVLETPKTYTIGHDVNVIDISESNFAGIRNETEVEAWASVVFDKTWISENLLPNTCYKLSWNVECTSVPDYDLEADNRMGFLLHDYTYSKGLSISTRKYMQEGEKLHCEITFITPSYIQDTNSHNIALLCYTNRYTNADGSIAYLGSMIFTNLRLIID